MLMPGETNKSTGTEVSLKEYFEDKFIASENARVLALEALTIRLDGTEKVTELSRAAMDKRLEGMNEFREALKDQQKNFISRQEFDLVVADIRVLREAKASLEGKADQSSVNNVMLLAIIGIFLSITTIVVMFVRH